MVVGNLETRVKVENEYRVWKGTKLKYWNYVKNGDVNGSSRIWLIYDGNKVNTSVINSDIQ